MLEDLISVLLAALVVGLVPGYPWARILRATDDIVEQLAYAVGISITLVPTVALFQARIFSTGLSLPIAISSVVLVTVGGAVAYIMLGPAKGPTGHLAPPPKPLELPTLIPFVGALLLMLGAVTHVILDSLIMPLILVLILAAGTARLFEGQLFEPRKRNDTNDTRSNVPSDPPPDGSQLSRLLDNALLKYGLLAGAFGMVAFRAYSGPLRFDWPYLRGVDQFEHVVMTNMTVATGSTESFMLYPPGFHYLTALIQHFSGLETMQIYPVLAPILLPLSALACYAVARGLWGWGAGLGAVFLVGVISYGPYMHFVEARYPNLLTGHFLLVLSMGALFALYAAPTVRNGILLALLGSSVVLYHQVASLHEAALLGLVALCLLPYLLIHDRRRGVAMIASFALLGVLAVFFAWNTYDLPEMVGGALGVSEGGRGGDALSMALGTQAPMSLVHQLATISHPVLWLGMLGTFLLLADRGDVPYTLARVTLMLWTLMVLVGSRTSQSGFPERFERDLAIPLSLLAAYALVTLLRSLRPRLSPVSLLAASVATLAVVITLAAQTARNFDVATGPSSEIPPTLITRSAQVMLTPNVEAAGAWLEDHNKGGNILSSPYIGLLPSRAVLALGGYDALQSYDAERIAFARDLPPFGPEPLEEALEALEKPADPASTRFIKQNDVRYVVLHKRPPGEKLDYREYEDHPKLYETVYENPRVIIFEPQ